MRTCSGEGQHRQRLSVVGMGWIVVGLRRGGTRDVALDSGLSGMGQWWGTGRCGRLRCRAGRLA
jgi:hypothetical protein